MGEELTRVGALEVPDAGVEKEMPLEMFRPQETLLANWADELAAVGVLALVPRQF